MEVLTISKSFIVRESMENFFGSEFKKYQCIGLKDMDEVHQVNLKKVKLLLIDLEYDMIENIIGIKEKHKKIKVIVYDRNNDNNMFVELIRNNIDGYLTEIPEKEDLVYIFKSILNGKKYYDVGLVQEVIVNISDNNYNNSELLTPREKEVLCMVGEGLSNREIAKKLYITEHTIKKHITSILSKLDMRNRKDLIIYTKDRPQTDLRYG